MMFIVGRIKYTLLATLLIIAIFLSPSPSTAQEGPKTKTITLKEAIVLALENNLQLAAARKKNKCCRCGKA